MSTQTLTGAATTPPVIGVTEYLQAERAAERSGLRHELVDGIMYAMTGASIQHARIIRRLSGLVNAALEGSPCEAFSESLKLRVANDFLYPDLMIVCTPEPDPYYVDRPVIIVEVLSPSTADYDHGRKRVIYQTIEDLRTYILLNQEEPSARVYHRDNDGVSWHKIELGIDDSLRFEVPIAGSSSGFDLAMSALFG